MNTKSSGPCPCGSGKKFEYCCFEKPDEQVKRGLAEVIADAIAEANVQQPFSSLEEVNASTRQITNERNQRAMADFCGLSPQQMTHLIYAPFTSPETILFSSDIEPSPDNSFMESLF